MIQHFTSTQGYVGDVMPYYENGTLHLFYLRAPFEPKRDSVRHLDIAHAITTDFIHWEELPDVMRSDQSYDAFGCHTGSVIKNGDEYLFFYSGIPDNPWVEGCSTVGLCLARSRDLITWKKDCDNPIIQPDLTRFKKVEYRDPTVTYWPDKKTYLMAVSTSLTNESSANGGAVAMHTSTNLCNWSPAEIIWKCEQRWTPECVSLLPLQNKWYLMYQAWDKRCKYADAHVYYLVGDSPRGPWKQIGDGRLDGGHLWAGKPVVIEDRVLYFANLPTRENRSDTGNWQWGGCLAYPRQLIVRPDGSLAMNLASEITHAMPVRLEKIHMTPISGQWNELEEDWRGQGKPGTVALGEITFANSNYINLAIQIIKHDAKQAGVVLRMTPPPTQASCDSYTGYEISLDFQNHQLSVRSTEIPTDQLGTLSLDDSAHHMLRIILHEDVLEVFLNEHTALTTRLYGHIPTTRVGLFTRSGSATFGELTLYE